MKAVFIADAHIKGLDDPNQKSLVLFLGHLARTVRPDKLIILGDLFDFWTGFNEVVYARYLPVLERLLRLREKGTGIIYLEGNHDFFMGSFFTEVLGAEVYPDCHEITLDGKRILLSHGDVTDTSLKYRLWRRLLRSFALRALTRVLSPATVWRVARRLSSNSRRNLERSQAIERHLKGFARRRIRSGFDAVVLAHSHIAAVDTETIGTREGIYANPGSWESDMSYLLYEDGEFRLERYNPRGRRTRKRADVIRLDRRRKG